MRKASDLMKDLGFKEEGSDAVKKAFIKNLVRAAGADPKANLSEHPKIPSSEPAVVNRQLAFAFEDDEERVRELANSTARPPARSRRAK